MKDKENIPKTNRDEIEGLIKRIEGDQLREGDKDLITRLLRMWLVVLRLMGTPKMTMGKVKQMLFGKRSDKRSKSDSEKGESSTSQSTEETPSSDPSQAQQSTGAESSPEGEIKPKRRGHGRPPTSAYPGAKIIHCEDSELRAGGPCPRQGCLGHLYDPGEVHKFIRFESQPFIGGTIYRQKVLRCRDCGARFSAPLPDFLHRYLKAYPQKNMMRRLMRQ
jgi:hypothetical protein